MGTGPVHVTTHVGSPQKKQQEADVLQGSQRSIGRFCTKPPMDPEEQNDNKQKQQRKQWQQTQHKQQAKADSAEEQIGARSLELSGSSMSMGPRFELKTAHGWSKPSPL